MEQPKTIKQPSLEIEQVAMLRAKEKANVARWGLNLAVFLFAVMITNNILISQGVDPYITAISAVLGLTTVWIIGWKRGTQLFQRFYTEELTNLQQEPKFKATEVILQLTPKETEIIICLAQGYSNKKIAAELNISQHTVKNHIAAVMRKLNSKDRTEAVITAIRQGLIALPPSKN